MKKTDGVQSFTLTDAGVFAIGTDGTATKDHEKTRRHLGKQIAQRNAVLDDVLPSSHMVTPAMD